ncbi:MAG: nucleoside triphosphate pyrophosphohydrolase family protein [Candidatus Gastranaerophilales bacterium]|nr:nucleoside triphosphate pyrophosphohydrolase family protein [Candidatus Gastranaerophilales bacterium]
MNMTEYQLLAARTINPEQPDKEKLINFVFGLAGESGETIDLLKKIVFHGHDLETNRDKLTLELGDCLWYIAGIATAAGIGLDEIAKRNIEKLKARYPDGFRQERSINRNTDDKNDLSVDTIGC